MAFAVNTPKLTVKCLPKGDFLNCKISVKFCVYVWLKHILLVSIKGLSVAKVRRMPSPNDVNVYVHPYVPTQTPVRRTDWSSAICNQTDNLLGLVFNFVVCTEFLKLDVFHDTRCPHWDQLS